MKLILACLLALATPLFSQEIRRALPVDAPTVNVDDLARFLAGLPSDSLSAFQRDPYYGGYVKNMGALWERYNQHYFSKMRLWSAVELSPRIPMDRPVFYFFGGPDALSPLAYFPDAPVYILDGLEPVGSIASPQSLTPEAITEGLDNLRKSSEVILSFGHFITKDMRAELDRTGFRGVLPVISAFLALAGADIISVDYIGISPSGALQNFGNAYAGGKGYLPGFKIVFRRHAASPQTLYYVQANVVDDSLKSNDALLRWVSSFGMGNSYLKAASYLPHEPYFSRIRNFILQHSGAILQDDSGIPFRFLNNGEWNLWLFGTYTGTLDIFRKYYQPDLQATFASAQVTPLAFGTGYKWRQGESNLLLAVRAQGVH
jgi:hypothetical protein